MPNSIDPRLMLRDLEDLIVFKFEQLRDEFREVKNQMADLNQSVADLQTAVQGVADRVGQLTGPLQDQIAELQTTLQAERDAASALAAAEDQEDVEQNQALADAQAATDAALANAQASADSIEAEVGKLNEVAAQPAPPVDGGEG
jgi:chromosome segregation ATPase